MGTGGGCINIILIAEVILFLVFDADNRNVAVRQMAESCDVPAAVAEINNGLSVIHLVLDRADAFGHQRNFCKCVTNHGNSPPSDIRILRGLKIMKSFKVYDRLC